MPGVRETDAEIEQLQALLDRSRTGAGAHLSGIIGPDRTLGAQDLIARVRGMVLLTVATVTADGRPLAGPVDGYLLHGCLHFSSSRDAVRIRHLMRRPVVSATYVPDEQLAVSVHGRAELYDANGPDAPALRQAMLDHYLPLQGESFRQWLDGADPVGVRVVPEKMFVFSSTG